MTAILVLPDEVKLTSFGKILRSTSLDELPELLNILKGDMAVVGSKSLLVNYLSCYNKHQVRQHEVRPRFTSYAQVHGQNTITWEDKFNKDVVCVPCRLENHILDCKNSFETRRY